jgi:hypothetical protein
MAMTPAVSLDSFSTSAAPWGMRALGAALLAVLLLAAAGGARAASCPSPNDACGPVVARPDTFPRIHFRAFPGLPGFDGRDSTVSRTVTLVWDRDTTVEKRLLRDRAGGGFGGYNIYRSYGNPDTCKLELIRRFIYADTLLWHFPLYTHNPQFAGSDSEYVFAPGAGLRLIFVDPDSAGNLVKRCRLIDPLNGKCIARSDSIFVLVPPPGPPNGFALYYTITYAVDPALVRGGFEDLFVPDREHCSDPENPGTCCNMNTLALNLMTQPVFTTPPPTADLEGVYVTPNPYLGSEPWDAPGEHRVQFRNLPAAATVRIFTVAGDLVRELNHDSSISGSEDWDLKNGDKRDVTSGIYIYRVTAPNEHGGTFQTKGHFVIVR